MQSIEITAKSVDEARQQGASKLGVSPDQVEVTVIEESKGLFGKSQVRARCQVKETPTETAPAPAIKKTPKKTKQEVQQALEPAVEPVEEEPKEEKRGRRGAKKEAPPKAEKPAAEEDEGADVQATKEDVDRLVDIVRDLVSAANLEVTANVKDSAGKYVNIMLDGKDAAFLVGKHGEVLNALQYLLNIIATRKVTPGVRATLDANDYRLRREDALTKLATKIADQVLARQEEAVLDALPAFERRIVHKALSTRQGVTTYSEGEEPNRRVVIAPAE
jgi:spoIIIJ-associated protein